MTLASGCIIADPPEYHDPLQTPPVLDLYQANPSVQSVVVVKIGQTVAFTVPFRSEDAGEQLQVQLYIDGAPAAGGTYLSPSSFNDVGRSLSIRWTATTMVSPGCHTVTVVVAHQSTWLNGSSPLRLDPMKATYDAATVTWWLNVAPAEGAESTLNNCPQTAVQGQ